MGTIFEDTISKNPESCTDNPDHCDVDIEKVCKSIIFQNDDKNNTTKPNLLIGYAISNDKIILKYKTMD
jgi:hypothetical protein